MSKLQEIPFDKTAYSIEAIQKAAYRGMNSFTLSFEQTDTTIVCFLTANIEVEISDFLKGVEEFKKDVLDYTLRQKLKVETEDFRNLIIGIAFSETIFINNE